MHFCKKHMVNYNIKLGCPFCKKADREKREANRGRGTTFGYCEEHGDYCGSSCPFCYTDTKEEILNHKIDKLNQMLKTLRGK
jgi:phage/plasmid primase-like uncharacterized protein